MNRILFMSSRDLPGAHNDWAQIAGLLQLPADWDYALILTVFSDSFLQPVFQQPTDLWELTLRWNQERTRFKPGRLRRLTHTGEDGWVIPEFAWDPRGRRLLWTQNKFPEGHRVDQACVMRQIRSAFVARLSGVTSIGQVPFDLPARMREEATKLLGQPGEYAYQGDCGGRETGVPTAFAQETRIGRYAD